MGQVRVERVKKTPVEELDVEIVERKGLGHPDCIMDGIAEEISRQLSKYYLENFGRILHHNVDKAMLVAGEAKVWFGGGKVLKPIYILLGGRATSEVGKEKVPVDHIAISSAKNYLRRNFRFLDVDNDVIIDSRIARGSSDLVALFERGKEVPLANDTSFGIGFAPLSETERVVLETELFLNSKRYKRKNPGVGEDIKVMGLRHGDVIELTVACAIVSKFTPSLDDYKELIAKVKEDVLKNAKRYTKRQVVVHVNTGDDYNTGNVYITVTGLSAENGDDGAVGRGNRVNGLITPMRAMSLEAAAGKNPVSHVGKIYNVLAKHMAEDIVNAFPQVKEAYVFLLSQIGKPINEPQIASVQLLASEKEFERIKGKVAYIVEAWLEEVEKVTEEVVEGKQSVF